MILLHQAGYRFAGGRMEELTQVQNEIVIRSLLLERGINPDEETRKTNVVGTITENEIEREYAQKLTVQEFCKSFYEAEKAYYDKLKDDAVKQIQDLQRDMGLEPEEMKRPEPELKPASRKTTTKKKRKTRFSKEKDLSKK